MPRHQLDKERPAPREAFDSVGWLRGQRHELESSLYAGPLTDERASVLECSSPLELSVEVLDLFRRETPSKALHSLQAREHIARQSAGGPAHSRTLRAIVEAIAEERGSVLECSRPLELFVEALDLFRRETPCKALHSPQAREHIARQSAGGPAHSKTLRAFVEAITDGRGSVMECSSPLELFVEALDPLQQKTLLATHDSSHAIKSCPYERQKGAPMLSNRGISHGVNSQTTEGQRSGSGAAPTSRRSQKKGQLQSCGG